LPDIRLTSLREHATRQTATRAAADAAWLDTEFVFVTRHGTPIEPQNFHRDLKARCRNAGVREVPGTPPGGPAHRCSPPSTSIPG
jgi:hypothetical protein